MSIVVMGMFLTGGAINSVAATEGKSKRSQHISHAENTVLGTVVGGGVECQRLKLKSGETVSLVGRLDGLKLGRQYVLNGTWIRVSTCMQGRTFRVKKVKQ